MRFRSVLIASLLAGVLLAGLTWTLNAATAPDAVTAQANLRINEFMADNRFTLEDPTQPGAHPDWIELYNPGPDAVSLNGLFLTDNPGRLTRFPITDGLTIPAGGFLVFYADNDPQQGPLHTNFALSRHSGFIGLFSAATNTLIDNYSYGLQTTDVSEGRASDGGEPWRFFDTPTPGATNALLPPRISNVQQTPAVPTAADAVTITAVVTDADGRGLAGVTLHYSVIAGTVVEVPMSATGNTYTAQIPLFADRTLVRYYITALDIDDLHGRAPLGAPRQPYRYLVGFQAPLLYINEIMADNKGALLNPDKPNDFPDWIELYNPNPSPVSLDGLFLTDTRNNPTKYAIPAGILVPAEGFILFYADNQPELGPLHTNFALAREGEYVGLYANVDLPPIDEYEYGPLSINGAIGRFPDGSDTWVHTACVTPGAPNDPCEVQAHLPLIRRN